MLRVAVDGHVYLKTACYVIAQVVTDDGRIEVHLLVCKLDGMLCIREADGSGYAVGGGFDDGDRYIPLIAGILRGVLRREGIVEGKRALLFQRDNLVLVVCITE